MTPDYKPELLNFRKNYSLKPLGEGRILKSLWFGTLVMISGPQQQDGRCSLPELQFRERAARFRAPDERA
jgi:hypothetical protein